MSAGRAQPSIVAESGSKREGLERLEDEGLHRQSALKLCFFCFGDLADEECAREPCDCQHLSWCKRWGGGRGGWKGRVAETSARCSAIG